MTITTRQPVAASATDRQAGVVERHWLALILTVLGVWTLTPLLAPLFMHWGWTGPGRAIYALYAMFCHQLPERSWFLFGPKHSYSLAEIAAVWPRSDSILGLRKFIGTPEMGWKMAWSHRMVSFYGGFLLFGLLYALVRPRIRRSGWRLGWRWLIVLILPIALDGLTHTVSDVQGIGLGFRETNAWLAVLTGHILPANFYAGDAFGSFNSLMRLVTGWLASFAIIFWAFPRVDAALLPDSNGLFTRQGFIASNDPAQPDARVEFSVNVLPPNGP